MKKNISKPSFAKSSKKSNRFGVQGSNNLESGYLTKEFIDDMIRQMRLFVCSHGNHRAFECPGVNCQPMTQGEIVDCIRRMIPDDTERGSQEVERERLVMAFFLGKRIGWATQTP